MHGLDIGSTARESERVGDGYFHEKHPSMSRRLDEKRVSNFQERTLNLIRRRQRGFDRCSLLKIDSYQKKGEDQDLIM